MLELEISRRWALESVVKALASVTSKTREALFNYLGGIFQVVYQELVLVIFSHGDWWCNAPLLQYSGYLLGHPGLPRLHVVMLGEALWCWKLYLGGGSHAVLLPLPGL